MKNKKIFIILILIFIVIIGISMSIIKYSNLLEEKNNGQQEISLPGEIFKHWVRSYEEENIRDKNIFVYRPDSYNFPLSRMPRGGFEIRENGQFTEYAAIIAPNDANEIIPHFGQWKIKSDDKNKIIVILQTRRYTIEIISFNNDVLKIKIY